MLLELGLAVGGGLLNAAAGSAQNDQLEKQRQEMLKLLEESLIQPEELDRMLGNVNRLFNNRLVNTLNSTAIRSRGIVNSNVVKGATAGAMEGARIGTLEQTRFSARESNARTRAAMVGVNMQTMPKNNFFEDFTTGALTSVPLTMEAGKLLDGLFAPLPTPGIVPPKDTSMDNIGDDLFTKLFRK